MNMIKVYDRYGNYKDSYRPDPKLSVAVQARMRHAAGVYTKRELATYGIKVKSSRDRELAKQKAEEKLSEHM